PPPPERKSRPPVLRSPLLLVSGPRQGVHELLARHARVQLLDLVFLLFPCDRSHPWDHLAGSAPERSNGKIFAQEKILELQTIRFLESSLQCLLCELEVDKVVVCPRHVTVLGHLSFVK